VVGVDPPASVEGACGIVVCALGADEIAYVLDDRSVAGLRPEGWARAVAAAARDWGADRVIAEQNQGGDMVESVLRSIEARLPVRLVSASRGKVARAEPVAALFESGRARLAGRFSALEDELAGLTRARGAVGQDLDVRLGDRVGDLRVDPIVLRIVWHQSVPFQDGVERPARLTKTPGQWQRPASPGRVLL